MANHNKKLLQIKDLQIGFHNNKVYHSVVKNMNLILSKGEKVGIVGESGSGKSMTALASMNLLPKEAIVTGGSILFQEKDMLQMDSESLNHIRGNRISMIFQEPMTSLNPVLTIGKQMEESFLLHGKVKTAERKDRMLEILNEVGLSDIENLLKSYPHQLSGGMRQRVMIGMAMLLKPDLLIADEPTTALDVTVQTQILELLNRFNKEYHTGILLISHDLGVIRKCCSKAIVMNDGQIVEQGNVEDIFHEPQNEYTKKLLEAVPYIDCNDLNSAERENVQKNKEKILEVAQGEVSYVKKKGIFSRQIHRKVVKSANLWVYKGEIVGIVGESGSGKSTLAKAIAGLLEFDSGNMIMEEIRSSMVFQDPYSSLNPAKKVGWIIAEPLRCQTIYSKKKRDKMVRDMLEQVGLSSDFEERYIWQLSGGQRQRVSIACALIANAKFIILDEPVSALDVTVQAKILKLLTKLRKKYGLSYLFISHDLNVVYQFCDRVYVMKDGQLIEHGTKQKIFRHPETEYTKKLLSSVLSVN